MSKKIIYSFIIIVFLLLFSGCNKVKQNEKVTDEKDLKTSSCKQLLTMINTWEKEENTQIHYSFNEDGTGTYSQNKNSVDFKWEISESKLTMNDNLYLLSCDLDNNTITFTSMDTRNNETFVIKGTQIYKKLVGNKNDELKGLWYSKNSSMILKDKNSSNGKFNEKEKIFSFDYNIEWITPSKNIIIIQSLLSGKEKEYTYKLEDNKLKLYSGKVLVDTFVLETEEYEINYR